MNETKYRCFYIMDGLVGPKDTIIPDIASVSGGFWVNSKFEYTTGSDCQYWLPPASILYVRKSIEK